MDNSDPIVKTTGNVAEPKVEKFSDSAKSSSYSSPSSKESGSKDFDSKGSFPGSSMNDYTNARQFVKTARDIFQLNQELQSVERIVKDKESLMQLKDFVFNKYSNYEDSSPKTALSQLQQVLAPIESDFLDTANETDLFEYTDEILSYLDDL